MMGTELGAELGTLAWFCSSLLLLLGLLFFIAGSVGMLRFPDSFSRLHAVTKADSLGLGSIVAGLFLYAGMAKEAVGHKARQALFWLAALSLMALPLSSGALVKTGLKSQLALAQLPAWLSYSWLSVLVSIGAVITALLLLHLAAQFRRSAAGLQPQQSTLAQTGRWSLLALLIAALWLLPWWALTAFSLPLPVISELFALVWPLLLALLLHLGWQSGYGQAIARRLPAGCFNRITPAVYWSLWLKRAYQPVTKPRQALAGRTAATNLITRKVAGWRRIERKLNRGLGGAMLPLSAWFVCGLFSIGLLLHLL